MADNQQPQRDQDVVTYEAFTGLRNEVTPERFTPADLATAMNVDLDKSGRLSRRDGYTQVNPSSAHSLWADAQGSMCLFVSGGALQQLNANMSATSLAMLADGGSPVSFSRANDRVYFSNGEDIGIVENGAVRSWGLPVPALPMVATTVGNMPSGTYQFAVTQMRADGQESGAPLAGAVFVQDGGGLIFTLPPVVDPSVAVQAVYLSTANGTVPYLAGLIPVGTSTWTYRDDTTQLNLPLDKQFMGPAPAGQLVAYYRGRLFVAQGNTLYWSQPFAYELFDMREYVQLDGRITLLAPITDREYYEKGLSSGFFVGTDRSCGALIGSDPKDFQYVPKTSYGAIPGALDYVDGSLFGDDSAGARELPMWLSAQGICIGMPDLAIKNLTRSKYGFTATGNGAALFMPGPNRFIATNY